MTQAKKLLVSAKPLPAPSEVNKPFWDGLKRHELRIPRCKSCGAWHWLPKFACPNCLSEDLEWSKASGQGTIFTYSVVHRTIPAFADDAPYTTAAIELKERPMKCLIMSWVVNCKPEDVKIGMPVRLTYKDIPDEDITLPQFEPA